jgi:ribosomal protein L22
MMILRNGILRLSSSGLRQTRMTSVPPVVLPTIWKDGSRRAYAAAKASTTTGGDRGGVAGAAIWRQMMMMNLRNNSITTSTASSSSSSHHYSFLRSRSSSPSSFSTRASSSALPPVVSSNYDRPPTYTRPQVLRTADGRQVAIFRPAPPEHRKLKPHLVARRLRAMKTYIGRERNIRHSPWRLNLLCQFAAGLPLPEALQQLQFSKKSRAELVYKVLKRTSNLADQRDGLQISQLEVAECFATRATPLKRINIMGRGRHGKLEHRHAHMRVVLREIDFRLRIFQAPSMNQKRRWFELQQQAERDSALARAERDQVQRLERQAVAKATTGQ